MQIELEINRERITNSVSKRRAVGEDLGGRWERFANSPIDDNAGRLIDAAQHHPATKVARDMDMTSASLYRHTAGVAAQHWITTQG